MEIALYGLVLVVFIILFALSGGKTGEKDRKNNPFERAAVYCYGLAENRLTDKPSQIEKDLIMLKPGQKGTEAVRQYYIHKISLVLLTIFIGNLAALLLWAVNLSEGSLTDGKYIGRNSYGEGDIEVNLRAEIIEGEEKSSEDFQITVKEQKYERKKTEELAEEISERLETEFLGENSSGEEVRQKLDLITHIEGFPFRIEWESDNYGIISSDGSVANEEVKEKGEIVNLTAAITYGDFRKEEIFTVRVCPPLFSKQELLKKKIFEEIKKTEEDSMKKDVLILPDSVGQMEIKWKENKKDDSFSFFLVIAAAGVFMHFLLDKELHEKAGKRNIQLLMDYPGLIEKMTLYMSAGMTVRNAFRKIAYDYGEDKKESGKYRFAYEEMMLSCHELDSGISEAAVYEHFGKRCYLPEYMRLGSLLSQNLRKGNRSILTALHQEMVHAFEERKNTAKKLGEEAGTKLLIPMMIMLLIIMVLIMIPAYFSFSI